jgi:3-dehydroquinate synthase
MTLTVSQDVEILWQSLLDSLLSMSGDGGSLVFIDPIVLANNPQLLEIEGTENRFLLVPTSLREANKEIESLLAILEVMENEGIGRRSDKIYAIGGGVLLDVVSMACSIFRRGISVIKVPTTLLAFADAAIGIKTGVNFLGQRNRLGTYHIGYKVLLDPYLLRTLGPGLIKQGLGEIFKIAVIKSRPLFEDLEKHQAQLMNPTFYSSNDGMQILDHAIHLMLEELHDNPAEEQLMRSVDFGHTFSPLVEMESIRKPDYRALPHGYAVAYDCLLTSCLSNLRGLLPSNDFDRILRLYLDFDMDFANETYRDDELLWASLLEMKKHRGGNQNIPVPVKLGEFSFLQNVTYEQVKNANYILQGLLRDQ